MSITLRTNDDVVEQAAGEPTLATIAGRGLASTGVIAWTMWLVWRATHLTRDDPRAGDVAAAVALLALEVLAVVAAIVLTEGLWSAQGDDVLDDRDTTLPARTAERLGLDLATFIGDGSGDADETGAWRWARAGLDIARPRSVRWRSAAERAWAVVATDGVRRMAAACLLMIVLFTGAVPIAVPPIGAVGLLAGGVVCVALGHHLLSDGSIGLGSRLSWSMQSVGAGLGSGISRTGLPVRWVTTMATMVALNVAVALRGVSDRWTHGLHPMDRDVRVAAMAYALCLVVVGYRALRRLPAPELEFYGATRRLEEWSTRRLALGATFTLAVVGLVAGSLTASGW